VRAITLAYHDVADDASKLACSARPGIALYTIKPQDFRRHLEAMRERKAPITTINNVRQSGSGLPVFITFDDGSESAYTCVADELERYGWRGHFFITTNWIGRSGFMNAAQIRELHRRGHVIGSHSCSHPARMSRLSMEEMVREWAKSREVLGWITGEPMRTGSVPNGFYSSDCARAAARVGIELLFTSQPRSVSFVVERCTVLGRYSITRTTKPAFAADIAAGYRLPRLRQSGLWVLKSAARTIAGRPYVAIRRYLIAQAS
jgi:peptidoglycan/xylan/chitin deacetylase (PgdA/CDA1 family)